MASISDKLDGVIRDFNELIERNGGDPIPYKGGLTIMDHVEHIGKLVDNIPASSSEEAAQSATAAALSAQAAAASEAAAKAVEDSIPEDYSELSDDVDDLKIKMAEAVTKVVSDDVTIVTFTRQEMTAGIIKPDGTVQSASAPGYSPVFPVEAGEILTVKMYYIGSDGTIKGGADGNFRSDVYFADNTQTYNNIGTYSTSTYSSATVPEGAKYARVSVTAIMSGTYTRCTIKRTKQNGKTDWYPVQSTFKSPLRYSGGLTANVFQMLGEIFYVDSFIATLTMKVPQSFSSIKFGGANVTSNELSLPYIEVTPSQVIFKSKTDTSWDRTESHGLTIQDDLQIILTKIKGSLNQSVVIQSGGSRWTSENVTLRLGTFNYGFGMLSSKNVENVTVSISICDLYKPVWVCGDSWVTYYDTRWYYYAVESGFDFLHSGYAGED